MESVAEKPIVRVMGRSAVVSYTRVTKVSNSEITSTSTRHEETRVWQLFDSKWRQVHLHRGPAAEPAQPNPLQLNSLATA